MNSPRTLSGTALLILLRLHGAAPAGLYVRELARELDLSVGTVHRAVWTLARAELVSSTSQRARHIYTLTASGLALVRSLLAYAYPDPQE